MSTIGKGTVRIRDAANYGGKVYNTTTFTGETVQRYAAPLVFSLNQENFNFGFYLWEDISDFEDGKSSIESLRRDFPGKIENYTQFSDFFAAIQSGAMDFLELDPENFELANIMINAVDFTISVSAKHKTRQNYNVNAFISGLDEFEAVKNQYLETIVGPFNLMAWALAQTDRNLTKFE